MKLTEAEINSPLWAKLDKHWEERLQSLRAENDKGLSEIETTMLLGRIAEVKMNRALGNQRPEPEID